MLAYQFANGHYLVAGVHQFVRIGNFHSRLFTDPQRCTGKESTTMYVGGYAGDISVAHIVLMATYFLCRDDLNASVNLKQYEQATN